MSDKLTQREIIIEYLLAMGTWVMIYDLQKKETEFGWLGTSVDREARRLAEECSVKRGDKVILIQREPTGKYVKYRAIEEEVTQPALL